MKQTKFTARKRIMASASMLVVSAIMLSGATYAWFTMSREVEVQNIQMTATTPEDIQLALGVLDADASVLGVSGTISDPDNAPTNINHWSNTVSIKDYYTFGRLIPASSTNGASIFFTPDAAGVGRTLKTDAAFYQADGHTDADVGTAGDTNSLAATAATNTTFQTAVTTLTPSNAWNNTNDDGYYVDIPVYLRTSSSTDQPIYVCGYVTDLTEESQTDAETDDLYKAVRVAILTGAGAVNGGCLALADGGDTYAVNKSFYPTSGASDGILDSGNYNGRTTGASGINAISAITPNPAWAAITENKGATAVATLAAAGANQEYGAATKIIVRVWLEGEDINCWNENAGQDWSICLKFMKDALPAGT